MEDYLERFKAMVEELRAHPDVVVTHFHVFPPVSERVLLRARHEFGAEIPEDFIDFYRRSNGLQLRWLLRSAPDLDALVKEGGKSVELSYDSVYEDDGRVAGCVNIQPIQNVFWNTSIWNSILYFENVNDRSSTKWENGIYPSNAFRRSLVPIDYYHFYYSILLLTIEKQTKISLLASNGYFKNLEPAEVSSFKEYLEYLLASMGVVIGRRHLNQFRKVGAITFREAKDWVSLDLNTLQYDAMEQGFVLNRSK
jgi:hypothetical protein